MALVADGFDWDAGNRAKCQKHGIAVSEIEAFLLGDPRIAPDLKHSTREERLMFVVFTFRLREGKRLIRPLSARYMHKKEIEGYEAKSR